MRPLVFATRNPGKLVELRQLLAGASMLGIDEAAARIGRAIPEVDEDRDTFAGNAEKKAREVSRATGLPALADDSGLEVDALGGAPGVWSARYAGPGAGDAANNARLIAASWRAIWRDAIRRVEAGDELPAIRRAQHRQLDRAFDAVERGFRARRRGA